MNLIEEIYKNNIEILDKYRDNKIINRSLIKKKFYSIFKDIIKRYIKEKYNKKCIRLENLYNGNQIKYIFLINIANKYDVEIDIIVRVSKTYGEILEVNVIIIDEYGKIMSISSIYNSRVNYIEKIEIIEAENELDYIFKMIKLIKDKEEKLNCISELIIKNIKT